jgi:hypothetical protein
LKGTHPGTIPARFGLIWFSGFRGEDLNVIFYQNTLLLKIEISSNGQNCSILSQNVPKFELCKHNDELLAYVTGFFMNFELLHISLFLFLAWRPSWLEVGINGHNFGKGPSKNHFSKIWLILAKIVSVDPDFQPRWPPS